MTEYELYSKVEDQMVLFGKNLKKVRKQRFMSQATLGRLCGLCAPTICDYEKHNTVPSFFSIMLICNVLDLNLNDMVTKEM